MEVIAQNETSADLARTPGGPVEITACPISAAATVGTCTLIPDGSSAGAVRIAAETAAKLIRPAAL